MTRPIRVRNPPRKFLHPIIHTKYSLWSRYPDTLLEHNQLMGRKYEEKKNRDKSEESKVGCLANRRLRLLSLDEIQRILRGDAVDCAILIAE